MTDPRLSLDREALAAASTRFPNSPRVNYRMAEAEIANGFSQDPTAANALMYAEKAANLSLWDFKARRMLGALQELNGDQDNAEKSLRAAVRLAPNHTETNWVLANVLLRRGKLDESIEPFRKATRANDDLLPSAYDLLWKASGNKVDLLVKLAAGDASAQLSLAQFFIDQSLMTEALRVFRGVDREKRLASPKSAEMVRTLVNAGKYDAARSLFAEILGTSDGSAATTNLVWNGSFESTLLPNLNQFDWTIAPSEYARIGIDTGAAHSGSRSLKILFAGRDTTKLTGEVRQMVVLKPGARYLVEAYVKTSNLVTPKGPRIAIVGQGGVIAQSDPVAGGTSDWQKLSFDFVAPQDSGPKYIAVVRIPEFSYDDETRGAVWFDELKLIER